MGLLDILIQVFFLDFFSTKMKGHLLLLARSLNRILYDLNGH